MKLKSKYGIFAAIAFFSISILFSGVYAFNKSVKSPAKNVELTNTISQNPVKDYWYQGLAEITAYRLEQARYGEIRHGHASLVFVTEPFSKQKQVKLDNPSTARNDEVSVLKLNLTKKFNTGIYPYSMMTSTFTPMQLAPNSHALKITSTSQEWCGQTFMQINNRERDFSVELRSYFESEGDENFTLKKTWLEDELWTLIRLNPDRLPVGNLTIVPGVFYTRLRHTPFQAIAATATLGDHASNPSLKTYTLEYPEQSRRLSIHFQSKFPYIIEGWEETHPSGFGSPQLLTTRAIAIKTILSDYWRRNRNSDSKLREELGLPI